MECHSWGIMNWSLKGSSTSLNFIDIGIFLLRHILFEFVIKKNSSYFLLLPLQFSVISSWLLKAGVPSYLWYLFLTYEWLLIFKEFRNYDVIIVPQFQTNRMVVDEGNFTEWEVEDKIQ